MNLQDVEYTKNNASGWLHIWNLAFCYKVCGARVCHNKQNKSEEERQVLDDVSHMCTERINSIEETISNANQLFRFWPVTEVTKEDKIISW